MRKLQQKYPNSFAVKIIDDWLREGLMVDLLPIVKNAIFLGEESYSIKKVEKLYKEERKTVITNAASLKVSEPSPPETGICSPCLIVAV